MFKNPLVRLALIVLIALLAIWVDASKSLKINNLLNDKTIFSRDVDTRLGLDLRGGLQVLMEADLPANTAIDANQMEVARTILENRTNALGVAENSLQIAGDRRIVGEFPGLADSDAVLATLKQTGLLEFVNFGTTYMPPGTIVKTDFGQGGAVSTPDPTATPAPVDGAGTPAPIDEAAAAQAAAQEIVYHTVMTGTDLDIVAVGQSELGEYFIDFTLKSDGADIFADYTSNNIGTYLGIVLDKTVISSPTIESAITSGQGMISGNFTLETANDLVVQLKYGSLPIPMKIVETRIIGPTLGEDSLQKSLVAGVIGMIIVILFMLLYYRMPGIVAVISILFYGVFAFAIFKYFHFTLTLPGIAGFMLSTGAALDANILIFERLKEELRGGRNLTTAVEQGWLRAKSSIFDSNIAAIITSVILFWFGNTFGATIVKGFSVTLALGVIVSLFTAIFVTRTLLGLFIKWFKPKNLERWFGI